MPLDPLNPGGEPIPEDAKPMPERLAEAIFRIDENIAFIATILAAVDAVLRCEEFDPESGAKQLRFTTQRFLDFYAEERAAQEGDEDEDEDQQGPAPN